MAKVTYYCAIKASTLIFDNDSNFPCRIQLQVARQRTLERMTFNYESLENCYSFEVGQIFIHLAETKSGKSYEMTKCTSQHDSLSHLNLSEIYSVEIYDPQYFS